MFWYYNIENQIFILISLRLTFTFEKLSRPRESWLFSNLFGYSFVFLSIDWWIGRYKFEIRMWRLETWLIRSGDFYLELLFSKVVSTTWKTDSFQILLLYSLYFIYRLMNRMVYFQIRIWRLEFLLLLSGIVSTNWNDVSSWF